MVLDPVVGLAYVDVEGNLVGLVVQDASLVVYSIQVLEVGLLSGRLEEVQDVQVAHEVVLDLGVLAGLHDTFRVEGVVRDQACLAVEAFQAHLVLEEVQGAHSVWVHSTDPVDNLEEGGLDLDVQGFDDEMELVP